MTQNGCFTSPELARTLERLADTPNYSDWIARLVTPYIEGRVLEVGAGIGTISLKLAAQASHLYLAEPHQESFERLAERLGGQDRTSLLRSDFAGLSDLADLQAVVMINVLEHIEDDAGAVNRIGGMLAADGKLVMFVPAFPALYSKFDREIGHFRRYRLASMRALLPDSSWHVEALHYVNAPGLILWWLGMRVMNLSPASSAATAMFDRWVVPGLSRLEAVVHPPFGQSIFAVAVRR